jgi:hypothetical protein
VRPGNVRLQFRGIIMNEQLSRLLGNLQNVLTEVLWSSGRFIGAIGEMEQAGYEIRFSVDAEVVGDSRLTCPSQLPAERSSAFDRTLELTSDDERFLQSLNIGT